MFLRVERYAGSPASAGMGDFPSLLPGASIGLPPANFRRPFKARSARRKRVWDKILPPPWSPAREGQRKLAGGKPAPPPVVGPNRSRPGRGAGKSSLPSLAGFRGAISQKPFEKTLPSEFCPTPGGRIRPIYCLHNMTTCVKMWPEKRPVFAGRFKNAKR
jgi:hypothetical protein